MYPTGVKAPAPEIGKNFHQKYKYNIHPEQYDNMELLLDLQGAIKYPTLDQRDPHLAHTSSPWPTLPLFRPDMYTRVATPSVHGIPWHGDPYKPEYIRLRPNDGLNAVSGGGEKIRV